MEQSIGVAEKARELAWTLWDPIGLSEIMGGWKGQPFEDEYDRYMSQAIKMRQHGDSIQDVVTYFLWVEIDHMGLGSGRADQNARALQLATAVFELPLE
ncbi:hypothetical protein KMP13_17010 [Epibacterium ulvae]|uniref:hypothetical protein n=1 Tax=Epibacterium ulvae TaxID=1156985 RepID=UPI001BFC0CD5|nr:hypothetical protein [Epibacterium ulvae]MBT8155534.1 hypothetical protein [Epibacterium ulvae]